MKQIIKTDKAPAAVGTYSQAVESASVLYVSGQIPLDPQSGEIVSPDAKEQIHQAFANFHAVVTAADASLEQVIKLTVYLTDLSHFHLINEKMEEMFPEPYPARAVIQAAGLPKGVQVEVEGIVQL